MPALMIVGCNNILVGHPCKVFLHDPCQQVKTHLPGILTLLTCIFLVFLVCQQGNESWNSWNSSTHVVLT